MLDDVVALKRLDHLQDDLLYDGLCCFCVHEYTFVAQKRFPARILKEWAAVALNE